MVLFCSNPIRFGEKKFLKMGTPVNVILEQPVSSEVNGVGNHIQFRVLDAVEEGEHRLIEEGAKGFAILDEVSKAGRIGWPGKMKLRLFRTEAVDGQKVPLSGAFTQEEGHGRQATSIALTALTSLTALFPLSLLFLLIKGKSVHLPIGKPIQASVAKTMEVDARKIPKPALSVEG